MESDQIIRFWGSANLKRWPASLLVDVQIPQLSKRYLSQVGLPCNADWTFRFDDETNDLPRLPAKSNYRQIGFDEQVPLCLDEAAEGWLIAYEVDIGGGERYINANIETFGEFLLHYQQYRRAIRTLPKSEVFPLMSVVTNRMQKADPTAFADANYYWPVIIEQMSQGLL